MQAIHMTAPGPAEEVLQLVDIPAPQITRPTQIRVQLRAAGVNPIDTKLRSRGLFYPNALPAILGCDGAGIVTDTGTDVKRFRPGDAVWFCHGGLGGEQMYPFIFYAPIFAPGDAHRADSVQRRRLDPGQLTNATKLYEFFRREYHR